MGCGPDLCRKAAAVGIGVSAVGLVAPEAVLSRRKQASRRRCLAATKALWLDGAAPARRQRRGAGRAPVRPQTTRLRPFVGPDRVLRPDIIRTGREPCPFAEVGGRSLIFWEWL
jgi:hypothetical protein